MSNTLNALTKKYAVLMDAAYRKNIAWDQGFDIEEDLDAFGFSNFNEILTGNDSIAVKYRDGSPEGRILINEGHYYNPATGFSAFIVNDNTKILVVLRGTDSASSSVTGTIADSIPLIANPERTDAGDGNSNLFLGFGTAGVTQWDDVRALIHAVATSRNLDLTDEEDKQQIAVVGQSLGGGLAGLASAYFGLEGHVYAPAPFALQLDTEADLLAVEQLIELHEADNSGIKFSSEFLAKSDALQRNDLKTNLPIALSEGNHDQLLALNIFTDTADVFETANALFSQYSNFVSNNLTQFRENLKTKLNAATLLGETLTTNFPDFLSTIINIGGDHFNEYLPGGGTLASDVFIDIGDGDDVSKHNFSIHNLVISTHDADKSFGELLKNNDLVRRAFLDKGGIIGPISHAREGVTSSGPDRDQSALTVGLVDTSIVNRALFNSYFEQDGAENKAMYNYFHSLFTEHLFDGAVGQGKELPATSITIHSGVTKLALGILRDATQSTGKLEEIEENIEQRTGFENFAFAGDKFGSSDGMVIIDQNGFLDELPLGVLDADERRAEQLEFGVQQIGIRDVNFHVFKRAAAGLGIQVTTNISQPESVIGPLTDAARFFGTDFIGVNYTANYEDDNLYGKQKWEVLVAQAGSDDGGLEFNVAGENGENTEAAQRAHLIIGGEGQNIITGGLSDDILVGGDGTGLAGNSGDVFANSFVWTGGNDVFIGGKSTDKYTFTGTHTSVPNADSPSGDFVQGNLFLAGDGIDVADYSQYENASNYGLEVSFGKFFTTHKDAVYVSFQHENESTDTPRRIRDELFFVDELIGSNFEDTVVFENLEILEKYKDLLLDGGSAIRKDGTEGFDILDFSMLEGGDEGIDSSIFDVRVDEESGALDAVFKEILFRDFEKLRTTRGDERIFDTDDSWSGGEGEDPDAVDKKVRMILDADNLGKGNSDAFEDSVQILNIFLNHEYNSLGILESVSLSEGNDFLAADASKIVDMEEYVTNPEEVEQGADPIYGEREVTVSPGLFEIEGEEGNDLLIAKNANYIPPQDEIKDDPDTPEDESMPALPERRLQVSGGEGNDWLLTLGGIGADVIGGDGRDFILNTSLGGRIWGDDKEGTDRSESGLEDSDVFWYYPGTFIQDAAPNDILQVFGIPLSGGTNVPVLGGDAFSLLAFLAQFDNFNIVQDFFLPQIFYAFTDSGQLLIYNGFPSGAHPLIDTVDVDPRLGRVMVVEDYERGELTDAFFNRSAPGDLGLTFRIWGGEGDELTFSLFTLVWGQILTIVDVAFDLAKKLQ